MQLMLTLDRCNCNDTCGAVSLPHAPFRKDQGLQLFKVPDKALELIDTNSWNWAYIVNSVFLCFVVGHGIISLWEVSFTQAELRNKIFLSLADTSTYCERISLFSKMRYYLGKTIALCFYLVAIIVAIISPALFISSVVVTEIGTLQYPIGERNDAIGQVNDASHNSWTLRLTALVEYLCRCCFGINRSGDTGISLGLAQFASPYVLQDQSALYSYY